MGFSLYSCLKKKKSRFRIMGNWEFVWWHCWDFSWNVLFHFIRIFSQETKLQQETLLFILFS